MILIIFITIDMRLFISLRLYMIIMF